MIAATDLAIRPVATRWRSPPGARWWVWLALSLILVLAAVLRLWLIHDVPGNVFYDAAVRSMGNSWHDFFFGALEPSGTV